MWAALRLSGDRQAVRHAAVGVAAIEVFVLGWIAYQQFVAPKPSTKSQAPSGP